MKSSQQMIEALKRACDAGHIIPRTENNQYLDVSYKGAGDIVSEKWNVKIYTSGSVVCNDTPTLLDIMNDKLKAPDTSKTLIQVDDAGWGFPLSGTMVGAICPSTGQIETALVDVSFFQGIAFKSKAYLREYARKGFALIRDRLKASPETHRIEICTGYVNGGLKKLLRERGYEVQVVEIKGALQDNLERLFKEHIKESFGLDLAYDPKEVKTKEGKKGVARKYYDVVAWGRKNAPNRMKTGWDSL